MKRLLLASLLCCMAGADNANADNEAAVDQARRAFVDRMVADHGFDKDTLTTVLASAEINQKILDAIAKPAERVVPWYE